MNQTAKEPPFDPKDFLSKADGGRSVSKYATNHTIYRQGDPAVSIFYILTGSVKLAVTSADGKDAVVAILGSDEFFGERCAGGVTVRSSTATALTECTIMEIAKADFMRIVRSEPAFAEFLISHLLIRYSHIQADLVDQLFSSSEKRLARALLLLANFGKESEPEPVLEKISQETLAEMIGTTRSRVNHFMNKFRRLGLISYNGRIEVHRSLFNLVLQEVPEIKSERE